MAMPLVALCADDESLRHPEIMGLAGENLLAQTWLRLLPSADEARAFLAGDGLVDEVWVVSSGGVAPINLAATLKRDRSDRRVCMLSAQESGSLRSRAAAAGIDASLTVQAFAERYAQRKQRALASVRPGSPMQAASVGVPAAGSAPAAPAVGAAGPVCQQAASPAAFGAQPPVRAFSVPAAEPAAAAVSRQAFLMPVVSGSGGAGKSTVAVLLASLAQAMGYNTLLLDFDLQFGDMPELLGVESPLRIDDVLASPARLAQLRAADGKPALLAAPEHVERAEAVVEQAAGLVDDLRTRFDVIVANTGAAWAEQHAVLLERSSRALFLVDQRPSSLRACRHALELCARCGIATTPFMYAVNRCAKGSPLSSIDVSCALRGAHVAELKDGGPDVEDLVGAGAPQELIEARNDLCASLERLALEVLPNAEEMAARSGFGDGAGAGMGLLRGKRSRKRRRG